MSPQNAAMGAFTVRLDPLLASDRGFIAAHRITTQRFSRPQTLGRQSIPQPWARSSFGLAPFRQAIGFYSNAQSRHRKVLGPENLWKAIHAAAMGAPIVRVGTLLASDRFFHSNVQNRHRKIRGPENFWKATHAAAMGACIVRFCPPFGKRSVFS